MVDDKAFFDALEGFAAPPPDVKSELHLLFRDMTFTFSQTRAHSVLSVNALVKMSAA